MPRLNTRWIGLFVTSAAALLALVCVVGYESYKEGTKIRDKLNAYGVNVDSNDSGDQFTNWTDVSLALAMEVTVDSFDPNKAGTLGFRINYIPLQDLLVDDTLDSSFSGSPSVPVRILLDTATINFAANTFMPTRNINLVLDGDVNRYPFDVFTYEYQIYAFSSPGNGSRTIYGDPLPLTVFADGAIQGWTVQTLFQGLEDNGSGVQITFRVSRSPVTKAFSIIVILVMWCLSGGVFVAAMSVWFRERKVELPLIAITTALLFALPNVRNSQPGIPNVAGTTSDMIGFFWNLLLVAVSAFSLIINFIIMNRREPVKPAEAPKEVSIKV